MRIIKALERIADALEGIWYDLDKLLPPEDEEDPGITD